MRRELEAVTGKIEDAASRSGAKVWEAFVLADNGSSAKISGGAIVLASSAMEVGVGLRVIQDGRIGFAYCTPETIEDGLRHARAGCSIGPEVKGGFTVPCDGGPEGYDSGAASMGGSDALDAASQIMEGSLSAGNVEAARGGIHVGSRHYMVANSAGTRAYSRGTFLAGHMMCTAGRNGEVTTGVEQLISRRRDLDFTAIGMAAGKNAISMLGGKPAQAGEMMVIFKPEALFDLLQNTVVPGFFGPSIEQGESFYSKKTGMDVAASDLTLVDDPTVTDGPSSFSFDEEGAGSRRVPLIEDGVMTGALYDNFAATRYGRAATASGMRYVRLDDSTSHRRPPTTGCRNLVMESETMPYDELVEETKRGIIVDRVMGSHTANRVSTDFSVAIYAGCYVENGDVVHPLRGGLVSGRAAVMLENIALADDTKALSGREGCGAYLPSVAVEGLNYSA